MGASSTATARFQSFPMMEESKAQVWSYSPEYRRPRHFHAEPEMNLVVHGSARFGLGEASVEVRAGELLGFPPGQDHVMHFASPDLVLLAVGARADAIAEVPGSIVGRESVYMPFHLRPNARQFAALVDRAGALAGCGDQARVLELWEAAGALRSRSTSCRQRPLHVLTRRAIELMAVNVEFDRGALAKRMRCHPTELSRHFHRDVGVTLVRYRTRLRLLALIRSVDVSGDGLVGAAFDAGFGSYSQCHRAFVAELGCSPSQFFSGPLRASMENAFEPAPLASPNLSSDSVGELRFPHA